MKTAFWFGVVTLFPDMFRAVTKYGITGRAVSTGHIRVTTWNPRDFTQDRHRTVDDRPYGGGPGMLMKTQPLCAAIQAARQTVGMQAKVIYLSPQGRRLDQQGVQVLAAAQQLVLVAGRYEGIDERVIQQEIHEEWSIGDYVLSGGELAAMTVIDSITRLVPGTLGCQASAQHDSFANGLLDCPHYTRPAITAGQHVPAVLLSGNHEAIRRWRLQSALGKTWLHRPDLLANRTLSTEEETLLSAFIRDWRSHPHNTDNDSPG